MQSPNKSPEAFSSSWQNIIQWGKDHYRNRNFYKDERIPTRPGLLYLVAKGAVRLVGQTSSSQNQTKSLAQEESEEGFLGFLTDGEPFEMVVHSCYNIQAYAHIDDTSVVWFYWHDLENWAEFKEKVFEAFRHQHQRKLLWLSTLGQKSTIARLEGFLTLLIEEYGQLGEKGYYLPYPITHAQIGSAIGSTRVTVTRLMGKLRQQGLIIVDEEGLISLPITFSD